MPIDEWQRVEREDAASILGEINPYIQPIPFALEMTRLSVRRLGFYNDYKLYKMSNFEARRGVTKYALRKPGHAVVINWTTEPIHTINRIAPLQLDENNVVDYIRFFFAYVRDREKGYQVVENIERIMPNDKIDTQARFNLTSKIGPILLESVDKNGAFDLRGCFLSCNALVKTRMQVDRAGVITISSEEKIMDLSP